MGKCRDCFQVICICRKLPIAKVEAICPEPQIRAGLSLCLTWNVEFSFLDTSPISPLDFEACGLFNIKNGCLQSVSTAFFAPDNVPTGDDLDQSTLCLPIPGKAGSITGEAYFFGEKSDYTASLKPYILEDGKTVTFLTNFVKTTVPSGTPITLIFVARLFYCAFSGRHC